MLTDGKMKKDTERQPDNDFSLLVDTIFYSLWSTPAKKRKNPDQTEVRFSKCEARARARPTAGGE